MKLEIGLSITSKMIMVISAILLSAIGVVFWVSSNLYQEDAIAKVQESNIQLARSAAKNISSSLQDSSKQMGIIAQMLTENQELDWSNPESMAELEKSILSILDRSEEMIGFYAYSVETGKDPELKLSVVSDVALSEFGLSLNQFESLPKKSILQKQLQNKDEFLIHNTANYLNKNIYSMSFMSRYVKSDVAEDIVETKTENVTEIVEIKKINNSDIRWVFRADFRNTVLLKHLENLSKTKIYIVDNEAKLLAHSDPYWQSTYFINIDFSDKQIVQKFLESKVDSQQLEFNDAEDGALLAAFSKISVGNLAVIAEQSKSYATASVEQMKKRALWLSLVILSLAILINYYFSQSITKPVSDLLGATEKIMNGNFEVHLQPQSSDEIGALTFAFTNMAKGLKERDQIKTTFHKFHSKEIAKKLLNSEVKLGGERKLATVFFSDLRGFTEMSEKMHADEVVTLLNAYLAEMVRIIYKWNGVVDKYIGDAIMAVWGVPESNEKDAYNAVMCALEMRSFMLEFNAKQRANAKPELVLGIGLHTGELVAGNIGSELRLEYTCIGDTVNTASRIEAANKSCESDILISSATFYAVKEKGIKVGPELKISAKGKSKNISIHQVIGYQDNGQIITTLNTMQIEKIQQQKLNLEFAEEKVKLDSASDKLENKSDKTDSIVNSILENPNSEKIAINKRDLKKSASITEDNLVTDKANNQLENLEQKINTMQNMILQNQLIQQMQNTIQMQSANLSNTNIMHNSNLMPHNMSPINSFASLNNRLETPVQTNPNISFPDLPQPTAIKNNFFPTHKQNVNELSDVFGKDIDEPVVNLQNKKSENFMQANIPEEDIIQWFVVTDYGNGKQHGPYSMNQLKAMMNNNQLSMQTDMIFKPGDQELKPIYSLKVFTRRTELPPIQHPLPGAHILNNALASEWFVAFDDKVKGPYTIKQLQQMYEVGQLQRSSYVWRGGLGTWIYLFQAPGFDRRNSA